MIPEEMRVFPTKIQTRMAEAREKERIGGLLEKRCHNRGVFHKKGCLTITTPPSRLQFVDETLIKHKIEGQFNIKIQIEHEILKDCRGSWGF